MDTLAGRMARLPQMFAATAGEVASRTTAELMAGFTAAGAVGCRVNRRTEIAEDPQVRHNGCLVEVDQGEAGRVRVARHPIRFGRTPAIANPGPAPMLGT
jgi:crotonobetainyl-CoA:carnitine CoA-transferase CaiB-like acyl-CoA transferase